MMQLHTCFKIAEVRLNPGKDGDFVVIDTNQNGERFISFFLDEDEARLLRHDLSRVLATLTAKAAEGFP